MRTRRGAGGRGRVAGMRGGVGLPRPTRYDRGDTTRGDTTRGRRCVQHEGDGEGEARTHFTTAEAAAMLGIAHETVKAQIRLGRLVAEQINPRLNMVTAASIAAYRRDHLGRRGRPKGAKNKPEASTTAPDDATTPTREGDR